MLFAAFAPLALPPDAVDEWFKERRKNEGHRAEPKGALQLAHEKISGEASQAGVALLG